MYTKINTKAVEWWELREYWTNDDKNLRSDLFVLFCFLFFLAGAGTGTTSLHNVCGIRVQSRPLPENSHSLPNFDWCWRIRTLCPILVDSQSLPNLGWCWRICTLCPILVDEGGFCTFQGFCPFQGFCAFQGFSMFKGFFRFQRGHKVEIYW